MKKPIVILAMASLLFAGCLTREVSEGSSVLQNDVDEVLVASDFFLEGNDSTAVIRITSNRSWSAHLNDLDNPIDESDPTQAVPWGYLSTEDHPNLANVTDVVDLKVTFRRNYSKTPNNGVINIYSEGGKKKSISLKQAGVKYYLDASCATLDPSDEGEEVWVKIACNNKWKAEVVKGATAEADILNPTGADHATLKIKFKENEEREKKYLTLKITSDECEPKEIKFVQSESLSDVPIMESLFKLAGNGLAVQALQPRIFVDKAINIATQETVPGVKFYYKKSEKSFDDIENPTVEDPEVPENGIQLLIESTSSSEYTKIKPYDGNVYIKVLAVVDGYRKSYEKILVRNWQFGYLYDDIGGTWGYPSGNVYNFPLEYHGLNFMKNAVTNSGWSSRLAIAVANDVTVEPLFGTRGGMYTKGNSTKGSDVTFYAGENVAGQGTCMGTSSLPQCVGSTAAVIAEGEVFKMTIARNSIQSWNITVFEQKKYKP